MNQLSESSERNEQINRIEREKIVRLIGRVNHLTRTDVLDTADSHLIYKGLLNVYLNDCCDDDKPMRKSETGNIEHIARLITRLRENPLNSGSAPGTPHDPTKEAKSCLPEPTH